MTGNQHDCFVVYIPRIRASLAIQTAGLCLFVLLSAAPGIQAQQTPFNGYNPYAQGYSQPVNSPYGNYGYPQGYQQPVQRVQYPNGYYGGGAVPGPAYSNSNGNGITYYYVQNPNGPNYYPLASPYGPPQPNRPVARTPTWPIPANVPPPTPVMPPPTAEDQVVEERRPPIPYHRPTNDLYWIKADYNATLYRPMRLASPLVTVGSPLNDHPGALGQPSTSVVFGNSSVDFGILSGVRLEGGLFLDTSNRFSLDVCGFWTAPSTQTFSIASDVNGNPLIARPIFNVDLKREAALINSAPGNVAGALTVDAKSEMAGIEFNARCHAYTMERFHSDFLVGFRYLRLAERLRIQEQINPINDKFLTFQGKFVSAPNSLADQDSFQTGNQFFGPQVGGRVSWEYGWLTLESFAKLGLGVTEQQTSINGSTTMITPTGNQTTAGGILALPSNIGNHNRAVLGIVPEFGLNLGVDLTQHLRIHLGYSLLLWNHVVRPGNQFDHNVNPTQVPGSPTFGTSTGPQAPSYRFNDEFFWSNSFNVGLEFHY
jgi:hypothetical protein